MSQLLDRYLFAIGSQLPAKQRADITAELRDVLLNRTEEREEALGRPMTADEESQMLKDFGHPLVVAGGYQRYQQLIGPTIYPFYVFTLKVVLGVMVAVWLAMLVLSIIGMHGEVFRHFDGSIVGGLLTAFAVVTLIMAGIERAGGAEKLIARWQPKTLPPVMPRAENRRFESAFELAFTVAFIGWWLGLIHFPAIRFVSDHGGEVSVTMAAVWQAYFWPVLALAIAACGLNLFELIRADRVRTGAVARIVYRLGTLGLVGALSQARPLMEVVIPGVDAATLAQITRGVDMGTLFALGGVALAAVFEIVKAGWRIWRVQGEG